MKGEIHPYLFPVDDVVSGFLNILPALLACFFARFIRIEDRRHHYMQFYFMLAFKLFEILVVGPTPVKESQKG